MTGEAIVGRLEAGTWARGLFLWLAAMAMCLWAAGPDLAAEEDSDAAMPWTIGGLGGAYLLVEPGELEVELFKRDLGTRNGGTDFRAILAAPDREVLAETVIPGSGIRSGSGPGPVQRSTLRVAVEQGGVFAVILTAKGDRYGVDVAWGMRTNAASFVVETARGHRDERHEEPIVLLDRDHPAEVVFWPRQAAFDVEVEALPDDVDRLLLFDDRGTEVASIDVVSERRTRLRDLLRTAPGSAPERSATFTVAAQPGRSGPWRLHLPRGHAYIGIDGVTRWDPGDLFPDQAVWTPQPASWFPLLEHRWLVSPYQRTHWIAPGTPGSVEFLVHNNAPEPEVIDLDLECERTAIDPLIPGGGIVWLPSLWRPRALSARGHGTSDVRRAEPRALPDASWSARLSETTVSLEPRTSLRVAVDFDALGPEQQRLCRVRATPRRHPEVSTYASLRLRGGDAPATAALGLPLILRPYAHENRQLGYWPDEPLDNQPYFDLDNRPFVVASGVLYRGDAGGWSAVTLTSAVVRRVPDFRAGGWSTVSSKVAFDADNDAYLLARSGTTVALLHSCDGGRTFTAYVLPGRETEPRSWDFESLVGGGVPSGPPPVVRLTRKSQDTQSSLRWRSVNDLDIFLADKTPRGDLVVHDPVRVTDNALGISLHSGIPSTVVSRGAKVHVVWGEATDPAADRSEIPGVPAYVATYDRAEGAMGPPVFLDFGPPPNDGHNTPSIVADGQGTLHVVVGTHGQPFSYLHSLVPDDAYGGWSRPVATGTEHMQQTYVGLVCGADDALHLVFRQWRSGEAHLDGATWAALAYQRRPPGGAWEPERVLVAPPLSEYSIYYHRLTVDRDGALFLSYDYWSTMWFYRNDTRGAVAAGSGRPGSGWGRAVLVSRDGGTKWSLW